MFPGAGSADSGELTRKKCAHPPIAEILRFRAEIGEIGEIPPFARLASFNRGSIPQPADRLERDFVGWGRFF